MHVNQICTTLEPPRPKKMVWTKEKIKNKRKELPNQWAISFRKIINYIN